MRNNTQAIKHMVNLSIILANASFKLKNERSYLGVLWYFLNPILLFGLLFFIFSNQLGVSIPFYGLYIYSGIILFNFFRQITVESAHVLYEYRLLIKSIAFPLEALVLSVVIKILYGHIFEIIFFGALLFYFNVPLYTLIFYIPVLVLFIIFTYGLALALAAIAIVFADLENIWSFFTQLLWFATPIFYTLEGLDTLSFLNTLNPVFHFIQITRDTIIYMKIPNTESLILVLVSTLISIAFGSFIFRKFRHKFTELL